MTSKKEP